MHERRWYRTVRRGLPLLALALGLGAPAAAAQATDGTLIVLVRHAERADNDPRDPDLSPDGNSRAALLATMLADVGLTSIWSTDYKRTRQTSAPVAAATGLEVASYDPSSEESIATFAETLRATPGRHLVVGHSNTTPAMVNALGGVAEPIEESEYDRLYLLVVGPDGVVTTTLIRFGAGTPVPSR